MAVLGALVAAGGSASRSAAQSPPVADMLAAMPVRVASTTAVTSGGQGIDFGAAVALDQDLLAVGAPGEDSSDSSSDLDVGAVYVYQRDGDAWVEMQKLRAPTQIAQERFGAAVSIARGGDADGLLDVLVVGGPGYSAATGRAHVFHHRPGGSWQYETTLELAAPAAADKFGGGVAVDWFVPPNTATGDPLFFIAVGAPNDADPDDTGNVQHGSVTLFQRAGGPPTWNGSSGLTFYGMDPADEIGSAVAMAGPDVVAAGEGIDVAGGFNDGGAQAVRQENFVPPVFNYALNWELQPSTPQTPAGIGASAALYYDSNDFGSGAVGAPLDDTAAADAGKVYIFDLTPGGAGTTRFEVASLVGASSADRFGTSVGITRQLLVAGATGAGPDASGQVLVFERGATKSDWTSVGGFDPAPPNPPFQCTVGESVAVQDFTVAIGCPASRVQDEGVYVYRSGLLFRDDFESGDTSAWSTVAP